jgi:hypothetical protein
VYTMTAWLPGWAHDLRGHEWQARVALEEEVFKALMLETHRRLATTEMDTRKAFLNTL